TRARRRRRYRWTRGAARGRARSDRRRDGGPHELGARARLRRTSRLRLARLAALAAALADGLLSVHVAPTFPLSEAAAAVKGAVAGRAAGAAVLTPQRSPDG